MTDSDKEFVRDLERSFKYGTSICIHDGPIRCLIALLIKAEAMRKKAEFHKEHHNDPSYCPVCQQIGVVHPCHDRADADWIEAERKEIEG